MAVERGAQPGGSQRSTRSVRSFSSEIHYQRPLGARLKDCCRSTIAFIFSNVGVCGLMVGYTIMGAFLFQAIEGPKEEKKYHDVSRYRNQTIERLWNITVAFNTLYPNNWTDSVTQEVKDYQTTIVKAVCDGWDGTDGSHGPSMWSIEGGFLYSLTVITTIGYGHISPRTDMGKIVTIFYTIFGMPVFLLYMANMGDILAKSLKWVYSKVCVCKKTEQQYDTSVVFRTADAILRGPAGPSFLPPDVYDRGRDGFGGECEEYTRQVAVRTRGPRIEKSGPSGFSPFGRRSAPPPRPSSTGRSDRSSHRGDPELMYLDTGEEVSIETPSWRSTRSGKTDLSSVNIPLTVSLVIMIALLYGGTKLFQSYEGWDALTSFYFCFISLTTIGFGDYVPGSSVESITSGNRMSFVYCSLYLMFGLALLSMCFNLMQEEVVHKFTNCVKAVTITRHSEPPPDADEAEPD